MAPVRAWRAVVDGGGSHTRVALVGPGSGQPVALGLADGSNLSHGVEPAWRQIRLALDRALSEAGHPCEQHDLALGLGLAGADVTAAARRFVDAAPRFAALHLWTDTQIALQGACGEDAGLVLLAGTGSVCFARGADGLTTQVGGYGFPSGDEGSGAWLGRQALGHAQRAADGVEPAGTLARAVWRHASTAHGAGQAEVGPVPMLRAYCANADQRRCAELAPLVFAASADDRLAKGLLDDAAAALLRLVHAADPSSTLPVVLHGSVAQRLLPRLQRALEGRMRPPQRDALGGALQLLDRALGANGAAHST